MSHSYELGYAAARRGDNFCPYEGATDASMILQLRWRDGYFDGLTAPRAYRRKRKITRRRSVRKCWPRSVYARKRLEQLIGARS